MLSRRGSRDVQPAQFARCFAGAVSAMFSRRGSRDVAPAQLARQGAQRVEQDVDFASGNRGIATRWREH